MFAISATLTMTISLMMTGETEASCSYGEKLYKDGEAMPSMDCNRCSCDGTRVACTLMACPPKEEDHTTELEFNPFDCNKCNLKGLHPICTLKACPPKKKAHNADVGNPFDCNQCSLKGDQPVCTLMGCGGRKTPKGLE